MNEKTTSNEHAPVAVAAAHAPPRTRPSIWAMVTRRLALRCRNRRAIDASPVSFAASARYSLIRVTST